MSEVTTTYLHISSIEELRGKAAPDARFAVREATVPKWEVNRFLYLHVGDTWEWTGKRKWTDERWRAYAESEKLRTFIGFIDESIAGYFELQKKADAVEIAYFGLTQEFIGQGLGEAMLTSAIETGFGWGARRVWVHTCTLDHPAALSNYRARGMRVYRTTTARRP